MSSKSSFKKKNLVGDPKQCEPTYSSKNERIKLVNKAWNVNGISYKSINQWLSHVVDYKDPFILKA